VRPENIILSEGGFVRFTPSRLLFVSFLSLRFRWLIPGEITLAASHLSSTCPGGL